MGWDIYITVGLIYHIQKCWNEINITQFYEKGSSFSIHKSLFGENNNENYISWYGATTFSVYQ